MPVTLETTPDGKLTFWTVSLPIERQDVLTVEESAVRTLWIHSPTVAHDLGFLVLFKGIVEELRVLDCTQVSTFKPIEELSGSLTHLAITRPYRGLDIDFSKLELDSLHLEWAKGAEAAFDIHSLRELYVYNFPYEDLSATHDLSLLKSLRVGPSRKLISTAGLPMHLEELGLFYCSALRDNLEISSSHLVILKIEHCKKLRKLDFVRRLTGLRALFFGNCGEIESLEPIARHPSLEKVYFYEDTKILDGDLSPLLAVPRLRDVTFQNRRHYSHTREQLLAFLEERLAPDAL